MRPTPLPRSAQHSKTNLFTFCSPQYYEIYKYKEVIGISILFMTVDLLGGVFNVLSLVFKGKFDVLAGTTYALVVVCSLAHSASHSCLTTSMI